MRGLVFLLSCFVIVQSELSNDITEDTVEIPQQVHLSLTHVHTEMAVTWVTFTDVPHQVNYRKVGFTKVTSIKSSVTSFATGTVTRYVHRATMANLVPGESYAYQVGQTGAWSLEFTFKQLNIVPPYRLLVYGDLGMINGESIPALLIEAGKKAFDLIIHVGDIAYDLHTDEGRNGDLYFNTLQPLFATVPYMVVAGNHEDDGQNFTSYSSLFTMPDEGYGDSQFYSFNVGPIHFVGISTEYYGFYYKYGMDSIFTQYDWLENDLKEANANRSIRPWIFTYMHRPFYCSNSNSDECNAFENTLVRDGFLNMPGLEKLFIDSHIDFGLWGHEHSYERFYPRVGDPNNIPADPYDNPQGPIYIISGSAGCHSGQAYFGDPVPFSAKRVNDYGYAHMNIVNHTHIYFEQISVEKGGEVVDAIWISKNISQYTMVQSKEEVVICHPKDMHCHRAKASDKYDIIE